MPERRGHVHVRLHVDAGLHAIARDVGIHDVAKTRFAHSARQVGGGHARAFDPAGNGHFPALRVDASRQAVAAHGVNGSARKLGVVHQRRA